VLVELFFVVWVPKKIALVLHVCIVVFDSCSPNLRSVGFSFYYFVNKAVTYSSPVVNVSIICIVVSTLLEEDDEKQDATSPIVN